MLKFFLCLLSLLFLSTAAYAKEAPQMRVPFPPGRDISDRFVGTVHRNDLIMADDAYHLPQTNVITFEPGSHSGWHVHGAMTIIGLAGTGVYQEWGKPAVLIRQGDVVEIPAGTSHWHGATKNSRFQQIVIYDKDWQAPAHLAAHTGPVSDADYQSLTFVDAADRKSEPPAGSDFLFAYPRQPFSSPNFNHPVYLQTVVGQPNEAGSPSWTYVVFPKGTHNRWHSHAAGQILIATDGVGYVQIKGEKPRLLHPGDVAYCPPGAIHWHGAAPGSAFAHIAISPQDNHETTWYDFPEYDFPDTDDAALSQPAATSEAALYEHRR